MKISFIIPTFNSEGTIIACITSILKQMRDNDEIIIVDNGSTDHTLEFLIRLGIDNILVEKSINISGLRNLGAKKTSGELLAFIDSDCVLKNNWVVNADTFMSDDKIHASGSKYDIPKHAVWIEKVWFFENRNGVYPVNYINSGNFIIKRWVYNKESGFNEALITGEDAEFFARLKKNGYSILSNERIGVIHLGNPKNLKNFVKKQYWHSLGMFGSYRVDRFDKPLIATFIFILLHFVALLMALKGYQIAALIVFTIPVLASFYRCIQHANFIYFFHFIILFYFYFAARSLALFKIIFFK